MILCQRKYDLELISECELSGSKGVKTHVELNVRFTSKSYDKNVGINLNDLLLEKPNTYRKLIGKMLYLTITIPDIVFLFSV